MFGPLHTGLVQVAHAAGSNAAAFGRVINPIVDNVVKPVVELAFAVAVLVFVYGVIQMVLHSTDADARKHGQLTILGGLIGMFIMTCAWGIIYLISNTVMTFR